MTTLNLGSRRELFIDPYLIERFAAAQKPEHPFIAPTPFYGMVMRNLEASAITANAMLQSASEQGVLDHGGHPASGITNNMHTAPVLSGLVYPGGKRKEVN